MTRDELKAAWIRAKAGERPTKTERAAFVDAYYANRLPADDDYSVYQWVEDGFPQLSNARD